MILVILVILIHNRDPAGLESRRWRLIDFGSRNQRTLRMYFKNA